MNPRSVSRSRVVLNACERQQHHPFFGFACPVCVGKSLRAVAQVEREACARVAERMGFREVADVIRARGRQS